MRLLKLLRTTAFRLALVYVLVFAVSAGLLIGFIYLSTSSFMAAQTDETLNAEITGLEEQYRQRGLPGLRQIIIERSSRSESSLYLLANADLSRIAGNLSIWPADAEREPNGYMNFTYDRQVADGIEKRLARARQFRLPGNFYLLVGRDVVDRRGVEDLITDALLWAGALTLALGLLGGFVISRNMMSRIEAINRTSRDIMEGDLSRRVELTGIGDEFDELASNLNDMLDQISRLMAGMREVSDNIAHDLRTPLNRLRSRLEVTLMKPQGDQEYREALEQAISDADGLISTFNALLLITRAESGVLRENFAPTDLSAIVRDMSELYEPVAEAKNIAFRAISGPPVTCHGDRSLISQALGNMIDNAIKYTPSGGAVSVWVQREAGTATLKVRDNGPGIPEADRARVLQRFVRLEASRHTPGSGLGLSLVAAVAQLHEGELQLDDAGPGLIASLRLPLDA
ncbi:MAG TPA: HAMP domain-containing sensor histidine kinase [Micropepsaceae bacterium]|nr:HAMP domain-containing sensor histidine kinase [Micropepsaceae bacterium]